MVRTTAPHLMDQMLLKAVCIRGRRGAVSEHMSTTLTQCGLCRVNGACRKRDLTPLPKLGLCRC